MPSNHIQSEGSTVSRHAATILLVAIAAIGAVVCLAGTAGAGAAEDPGTFVVTLEDEGTATLEITSRFDLGDESRREAFRSIEDDQEATDQYAADWTEQLNIVAENASDKVGREMTVRDASVSTSTTDGGDVGVVTVTVTWENLAAVDGNELTVTEPFASGFEPDREFTLVAPEGYVLTSVEPEPTSKDTEEATWNGGSSLEGFQVTATGTDDSSGGSSLPGFGLTVAVLGILVAAGLAVRRQ
jgi:PGF-CTERM protein